ncbi:hypothetical protein ACJMK2_014593 [Sinanodonta woodiana]|uniref:Uncharacterized protein n=1 Tax=Sinanodonta woodiana TaxID=1069815 RepID=A0ABD3V4C5_SINWO
MTDKNWKDCVQKTNATVEMIEIFPPNELPVQELLMNIYSYFSPTYAENWDFTMTIEYHDNDWICAVEKLLKTVPEEKYPYEVALLYFEITMRYLALQKSFENREYFKSRSLSAARKSKDQELQLFGTMLFVLAEWISTTDIGPAKQREYLFRLTFSLERSLQLAECLDDKRPTSLIQKMLQQVEVLLKRPYPKEIDHWMRRKLSMKIKYRWIKTHEPTFNHENTFSEASYGLASHLDGSSLPLLKIKNAISQGDVFCVQQYLENQRWEHEDELFDCLNYSLAFCDGDGKQTMSKHFISWICKEFTKSHQPDKVLVWAASIAKNYSIDTYLVLICNYWGNVDQKFKDQCFFGLPVIYQEYNNVSDEDQSVQCSKTFLETTLSPTEAKHANQILSEVTDWLMNQYSNLEVIKPCHVRSTLLKVKKETCIVLYCRMKGFIPFGECEFPKTLSVGGISFPTDVREGFYVPAMLQQSADGQNDSQLFRMGYSMGPQDKGIKATVGPFVKMEGNNVGFLTCAHAFGVPCNIKEALGTPVVHPAHGEYAAVNPMPADESICGYVDRIVFDIDPNNPVNVDVALIRLKPDKIPNKGCFARNIDAADPIRSQLLSFNHGQIMTKENIEEVLINLDGKIIKVGAASGVTSSNLFYSGSVAIRISDAELLHRHGHIFPPIIEGTRSYVMKGQYLIRSRSDMVFLIAGDSGSGVFYIDQSQRLRCIGIAIGFLANHTYEAVVTPIEDVLRALGLDENALMRFPVQ